jgi:hypothetical protein
MQSFNTADARHKFAIDGAEYSLPSLGPDEFEAVTAVMESAAGTKFPAMRDFLYEHADAETKAAVATLGIKQIGQLFRQWIGLEGEAPGESSGSPDVP